MPSNEAMLQRLVLRGLLPSQAEAIITAAAAANQEAVANDELIQQAAVTAEDIEATRQWFIYAPQVPNTIKRMPEARWIE